VNEYELISKEVAEKSHNVEVEIPKEADISGAIIKERYNLPDKQNFDPKSTKIITDNGKPFFGRPYFKIRPNLIYQIKPNKYGTGLIVDDVIIEDNSKEAKELKQRLFEGKDSFKEFLKEKIEKKINELMNELGVLAKDIAENKNTSSIKNTKYKIKEVENKIKEAEMRGLEIDSKKTNEELITAKNIIQGAEDPKK